jgi:hypothetical protein
MKKYLTIFNIHTFLVMVLCIVSSYVSLYFHLKLYIDFLILGIVIVFPITFSMRVAFRRRERALQYLSLFKASLQSLVYAVGNSKMEADKKQELKNIAANLSDELIGYLERKKNDASAVQNTSHSIYVFLRTNKAAVRRTFTTKLLLDVRRVNESIEFLLATRRHTIPWGPKFIVLFAIYIFAIFYPASLLNSTGFDVPFWYVFAMTGIKAFLLISFYNIQEMLKDPFDQNSPDGIRVHDFHFVYNTEPIVIMPKKEPTLNDKKAVPAEKLEDKEEELSEKDNE